MGGFDDVLDGVGIGKNYQWGDSGKSNQSVLGLQ
jgi:hypothetical protein